MNQLERQEKGLPYIADAAASERQKQTKRLSQQLNTMDRGDFDGIRSYPARTNLSTKQKKEG